MYEKLCIIVTLPRNAIRYLSFYLPSKFNTEIYKKIINLYFLSYFDDHSLYLGKVSVDCTRQI